VRIQPWHVVVLLIVVLLVFGSNRLPDVARSVGQSLKIFKREISELRDDPPPQVPPTTTPPTYVPPAPAAGVPPVAPTPPEQPPTDDGKAPQA